VLNNLLLNSSVERRTLGTCAIKGTKAIILSNGNESPLTQNHFLFFQLGLTHVRGAPLMACTIYLDEV